jgi:hypothetical protein
VQVIIEYAVKCLNNEFKMTLKHNNSLGIKTLKYV